jgi:CubicO group peptidase (beta-lactamase class C family)
MKCVSMFLPISYPNKSRSFCVNSHLRPKRKLFALSAFVLISTCVSNGQDITPKVSRYMDAQVEVNRFNGSILIAQRGKVLLQKRYGPAAGATEEEKSLNSRYRIGSIAKQFIAAAILQLNEKGKLGLQDSVCKHLAKCPNSWDQIKIFNLLAQTDGIPDLDPSLQPKMAKSTTTTSGFLARLADRPLEFRPGEKFRYGNSGYAVLGAVIEEVSGESCLKYLNDHIFIRLGMRETGYDDAGWIVRNNPGIPNSILPSDLDLAVPYSWGQLYSTAEDVYRWDRALNSEELLSKTSIAAMFTPYIDGYGFGWVVLKEFDRTLDTSAGGVYLFGSAIRRYAADGVCVIVVSNSDNADGGRISRDLAAILFGKHYELPIQHRAININPTTFDSYVGRYQLASDFVLAVSMEANRLMIQSPNQPKIEIFPESETRFFAKGLDAVISFIQSPQGKATQLVVQQGGREIPAPRIN